MTSPHGHDHDHSDHDHHDHGVTTPLGEQTANGYTASASRLGDIKPGAETPISLTLKATAKPAAVRFWIGTQDAKGSLKAKAEAEKDGWHTHVEAPKPLPAEAKLWVEIESEKGEKTLTSFDLRLNEPRP